MQHNQHQNNWVPQPTKQSIVQLMSWYYTSPRIQNKSCKLKVLLKHGMVYKVTHSSSKYIIQSKEHKSGRSNTEQSAGETKIQQVVPTR